MMNVGGTLAHQGSSFEPIGRAAGTIGHDQGKTIGEIIGRAAVEPHLHASFPGNDSKTIELDLNAAIGSLRAVHQFWLGDMAR
jgi:hypothetical protein